MVLTAKMLMNAWEILVTLMQNVTTIMDHSPVLVLRVLLVMGSNARMKMNVKMFPVVHILPVQIQSALTNVHAGLDGQVMA
jgi:hypothetical protein